MPTKTLKLRIRRIHPAHAQSARRYAFSSKRCSHRQIERHPLDHLAEQERLIIEQRDSAHRMARVLLRRWNVTMDSEEIDSLADLALCKAARHFKTGSGATFATYSFHYLRGVLIRAISKSAAKNWLVLSDDGNVDRFGSGQDATEGQEQDDCIQHEIQHNPPSPEKVLYMKELQEMYSAAVAKLSPLERKVIEGVRFGEEQISDIARRNGYSRGHFSKVLNGVRRNDLQCLWQELKEAA